MIVLRLERLLETYLTKISSASILTHPMTLHSARTKT